MYEILDSGLARVGAVEKVSSDNHSIHWQSAGTLTLIAAETEKNLRNLRRDRFVLIRDTFRQGDRLDGLYLICSVQHDEEKGEITVNGKAAPYLLHRRAINNTVLSGTTAGKALAVLANQNARGLPIDADWDSNGDPEVIRYPMNSGALDERSEDLMSYCGIGMEAVLESGKIRLTYSVGRDISAEASVPVLGKDSGFAWNTSLTVDDSDYYNVAIGTLAFTDGREAAFAVGSTDAQGADRRELHIGEIAQKSGESDGEFRQRAASQANATLAARLLRTTINADISPADYGKRYLVGDLVRVQVGPVTIKKRISAATWLIDQNNDKISLTLGDQLNTVVAEIREQEKANASKASSASIRAGGAARTAAENKDAIVGIKSDFKSLIARVDDVVAGMDAYVLEKVFEDYKLAVANLFAALEDEDETIKSELSLQASSIDGLQEASADLTTRVSGAEASINLNAQNIDGVASSVATIQADVIKLKGDTEILGDLSIVDGNLKSTRGIVSDNGITGASIYANGTGSQGIVSGRRVSCTEISVNGKDYTPTEITSTTGAVLVLGIA